MNNWKRFLSISLFLMIVKGICGITYPLYAQSVIPVPVSMERGAGFFALTEKTRFYSNLPADAKAEMKAYVDGAFSPLKHGKKATGKNVLALVLTEQSAELPTAESYRLSVTSQRILLQAPSHEGLFYGLQTLLQCMEVNAEGIHTFPVMEVTDSPRFAYRGFMLDVSRHFFPKEFVKKQIDALARFKINRLHLHLTDAAGWRIEIKRYPRLTQLAAWRTDANWKKWWNGGRRYAEEGSAEANGGYYTQDDIRELVAYAQQRCITLVPEIEMPAHSEEVLAAYPELSCTGQPYKHADFCVGKEATFTFLENVLTEVMALFPSEYIHVGGDEAGKQAWHTCPLCQQRMKQEGLKNVDELQSYLIQRMEKFLNRHGRKLLGWDEILQGGLAPRATVMSWRGEQGGIDAVRSGHPAIMTPGSHCYFDSYQDAPHTQPEAIGGYLPLQKVYAYNPVPDSLSAEEGALILGTQANLWTEYIPTPEQVEYMMYPRILALAEVAWSTPERKSWDDFRVRALQAVKALQAKGYHTFDLSKEIGHRPESLQPVKHLALGKKVTYRAPYNNTYCAQGETSLTDGIRGDWTYGDGAWQGFISRNRMDVVIDMEEVTDLRSISADFIQVVGAEVYWPVRVVMEVSEDGENYTTLKEIQSTVNKDVPNGFEKAQWTGQARGRYIRFQAKSSREHGGWVFTDEIVVQ